MTSPLDQPIRVLLVEPQFVLRRTLCSVAEQLGLARVTEALSVESAQSKFNAAAFDALILGSVDESALARWVTQIRSGQAACPKDLRIVAMLNSSSKLSKMDLQQVGVDVVIERPFKVAQVFASLHAGHHDAQPGWAPPDRSD